MRSSKQKGDYYRRKTVKYLEEKGYQVATIEKLQRCFINGKVLFLKKDVFGADLLAMNEKEIIFVQVKFRSDHSNQTKAVREEFNKYVWPPHVKRQLIS